MTQKTSIQLKEFMNLSGIDLQPVGVFDVVDPSPFAPFADPEQCIFSHFSAWQEGKNTIINSENAAAFGCPGAAYWLCGIHSMPREATIDYLFGQEGLKASAKIMSQWMETHPPYTPENNAVVISRMDTAAADDHTEQLKTVTFFIRPDQLALLVTGGEHLNGSPENQPVSSVYGAGCGQMLSHFKTFDSPQAMIGGTDIAIRKHLPPDILAFTVTSTMLKQLLNLNESSFLHKTFWNELKAKRAV